MAGFSVEQLADAIWTNADLIRQWEQGQAELPNYVIGALAEVYGVSQKRLRSAAADTFRGAVSHG